MRGKKLLVSKTRFTARNSLCCCGRYCIQKKPRLSLGMLTRLNGEVRSGVECDIRYAFRKG